MAGFVRRSGPFLYSGSDPLHGRLRFASFNIPNLHVIEDPVWHLPDPWEQLDALESVRLLGGQVARIYCLSIQPLGAEPNSTATQRHVSFDPATGAIVLNETLFRSLDSALQLAQSKGIKLIIPFIDRWSWWGGIQEFTAFYAKPFDSFFTDPQVISGFKSLLSLVLNRVNTLTGIAYKDDPTVLCWESGNELELSDGSQTPADWTIQIAQHIRSLDGNHLICDGSYVRTRGFDRKILSCDSIDIVTNHYYDEGPPSSPVLLQCILGVLFLIALLILCMAWLKTDSVSWIQLPASQADLAHPSISTTARITTLAISGTVAAGLFAGLVYLAFLSQAPSTFGSRILRDATAAYAANKSFIVGEVGLSTQEEFQSALDALSSDTYWISGLLFWSLRFHSKDGGFYTHHEQDVYWAYHYPGLPANPDAGFPLDEQATMNLVRSHIPRVTPGYQLATMNLSAPALLSPRISRSVNFNTQAMLSVGLIWKGTAGAQFYRLARRTNNTSTHGGNSTADFVELGDKIYDNQGSGSVLFWDNIEASQNVSAIEYRVRGISDNSTSPWSETLVVTLAAISS